MICEQPQYEACGDFQVTLVQRSDEDRVRQAVPMFALRRPTDKKGELLNLLRLVGKGVWLFFRVVSIMWSTSLSPHPIYM